MSRVIAYKEPGWFHPNADRQLWRHLCRAYAVELEQIDKGDEPVIMRDETVVIVDEKGEMPIEHFEHPRDCVYVFGMTHQNNLIEMPHDYSVSIEYPGEPCLFGCQAAAIVLEDRKRKSEFWR
jgi:hypothetical protein